jgi:hypothetical protein
MPERKFRDLKQAMGELKRKLREKPAKAKWVDPKIARLSAKTIAAEIRALLRKR